MATNGLVVMTPTSIAYSGTSASINADGSVDFSAVTSLSLNGVFTGDYDNYMISMRHSSSAAYPPMGIRYRASGTDATGTNYTRQLLSADSTTIIAARDPIDSAELFWSASTARSGSIAYIFGPYLTQPTAGRGVTGAGDGGGWIIDGAHTHSLSTSYDGITFLLRVSGNFTGLVTVFGFNQ